MNRKRLIGIGLPVASLIVSMCAAGALFLGTSTGGGSLLGWGPNETNCGQGRVNDVTTRVTVLPTDSKFKASNFYTKCDKKSDHSITLWCTEAFSVKGIGANQRWCRRDKPRSGQTIRLIIPSSGQAYES